MLREIKFLCLERSAEDFADMMMDAGAMSVSIEDADLGSPDERPLYGEPGTEPDTFAWNRSIVSVLADETFDATQAAAIAAKALGIETPVVKSDTTVPDEDWVRITQAQFSPVKVSDRLWIVPSWHEPPSSEAINIRLDPGVAFGTGSHPTTHLCLQWLDTHVTNADTVLDYGCGTGILAIAAAKLGAANVTGTDIDPQAVESAAFNAEHNEVTAKFVLPGDLPANRYSLVVANILSNPLKVLAPALLGRVAPGRPSRTLGCSGPPGRGSHRGLSQNGSERGTFRLERRRRLGLHRWSATRLIRRLGHHSAQGSTFARAAFLFFELYTHKPKKSKSSRSPERRAFQRDLCPKIFQTFSRLTACQLRFRPDLHSHKQKNRKFVKSTAWQSFQSDCHL